MEKVIRNELLGYIIPSLSIEDLGNFSLTSIGCRELAIGEISKKALKYKVTFEAIFILNEKICGTIDLKIDPITPECYPCEIA